jgi:hypothetical protein
MKRPIPKEFIKPGSLIRNCRDMSSNKAGGNARDTLNKKELPSHGTIWEFTFQYYGESTYKQWLAHTHIHTLHTYVRNYIHTRVYIGKC